MIFIYFVLLLPNKDTTPQIAQIVRQRPILPEYFSAAVGDTNIPDPIITPIIILTADKRPIFLFKPTFSLSSLVAAKTIFENNQ